MGEAISTGKRAAPPCDDASFDTWRDADLPEPYPQEAAMARSYIVDDPVKKRFLLDREALVSPGVLQDEMRTVFAKSWIYVGHGSELKKPNDFVTRRVAGRPVIF